MAGENSLNGKEMIKDGPWNVGKEERTWLAIIRLNTIDFFQFSKLCLMVGAKIITMSHMVLNVY